MLEILSQGNLLKQSCLYLLPNLHNFFKKLPKWILKIKIIIQHPSAKPEKVLGNLYLGVSRFFSFFFLGVSFRQMSVIKCEIVTSFYWRKVHLWVELVKQLTMGRAPLAPSPPLFLWGSPFSSTKQKCQSDHIYIYIY
jgi:hypothetical protein